MQKYYSNGKLILTAEYVVLNGATALALPTKFGQSMNVQPIAGKKIIWESFLPENELWFTHEFSTASFLNLEKSKSTNQIVQRLQDILAEAHKMNPGILQKQGYHISTKLDFPQDWGLGSSSTLINNIANWFQIDAFLLLEKTFGGSGYDIACAQNKSSILFKIEKKQVRQVDFDPDFKDELFFVHLNQKKNSREAIEQYNTVSDTKKTEAITQINKITEAILACTNILEFEKLLLTHEQVMCNLLNIPTIKEERFPEFPRAVKSLGAWGGDFVLAVGNERDKQYFKHKGYHTIISYQDMIL